MGLIGPCDYATDQTGEFKMVSLPLCFTPLLLADHPGPFD